MRKLETAKRLILLGLAGIGLLLETLAFWWCWITNFSPSITQLTGVPYYYRVSLLEVALYAGICVFLISQVLDFVLYGRDEAKLIYIISDCHEQIAKRLLAQLSVGVTYVEGIGAYSGKGKKVIMCAVKKPMAPKTEDVVREEDPQAFMIVTSATEIYGEGYKSYFSERL